MSAGKKNNVISEQIRKKGNESFYQKDYFDALSKYNEALRYAEINSKELGLCYGNRSAVYLQVKQFNECLENIRLARQNNYPNESLQKLIKREDQCKKLMENAVGSMEKPWNDFYKMSYSSHPNIPFLADCVELKELKGKKRGMFLATKRDLKAGDIIGVTEPMFRFPYFTTHRCSYCLADKFMNYILCSGCVDVMFCNEMCMKNAINEFHQFDCGIYDNPVVPNQCLNALQIIMKCLPLFNGSSKELETFLERNQNQLVTPFDFSVHEPKSFLSEKNLLQIQSCKHQQGRSSNNEKSFSEVQPFLQRHPKLQQIVTFDLYKHVVPFSSTEYLQYFSSVDRIILSKTNQQHIIFWPDSKFIINSFGGVLDVCFNLLLHSCVPTMCLNPYNGKMIWIIIQPIKAGDWLSVAFENQHFFDIPCEKRKMIIPSLLSCCKCPACTGNWKPLYENKLPFTVISRTSEEGIVAYKDLCNKINERPKQPPGECDEKLWLYISHFMTNIFSIGRASWIPTP